MYISLYSIMMNSLVMRRNNTCKSVQRMGIKENMIKIRSLRNYDGFYYILHENLEYLIIK